MIDYRRLAKISPSCPICGGTDFEPLASNDRYGMRLRTAGCLGCGLAQTWPRPTAEAMSLFYREHYRHYYQAAATPDTAYVNRFNKTERLAYTAALIEANVKLFPGMRVLDIGCAEGTLAAQLKKRCEGLVVVGVEPSESFAAYAMQATAIATYPSVDALREAGQGDFGLIIVNHVLEHVDDPPQFLRGLRTLLVAGGKLYVDVPDVASYASPQTLHIAHLFHFSQRTLAAVIEKAGFHALPAVRHAPPHHPVSLWCVAENDDIGSHAAQAGVQHEQNAWERIRRADGALRLYLLAMKLRQNRLLSPLLKALRALRRGRA